MAAVALRAPTSGGMAQWRCCLPCMMTVCTNAPGTMAVAAAAAARAARGSRIRWGLDTQTISYHVMIPYLTIPWRHSQLRVYGSDSLQCTTHQTTKHHMQTPAVIVKRSTQGLSRDLGLAAITRWVEWGSMRLREAIRSCKTSVMALTPCLSCV